MSIGSLVKPLLEHFVKIESIRAAAVVDLDGLVIASQFKEGLENNDLIIGAVTSQIQAVSERMKKELKMTSRFGTSTMDTEAGKVILINVGNSGAFTTITELTADMDYILSMAYIVVEKLVQIIEDENFDIDIELPDLRESENKKFLYKMCILGDGAVGKTTLLTTFIKGLNRFRKDYKATIGANIMNKEYKLLNNITVSLNIWDLAGQFDYFYSCRQVYLTGSQAVVLVFDSTRRETFDNIQKWYDEVLKLVDKNQVEFLLVGNKIDLEDEIEVPYKDAKELSKKLEIPFIQTSAKNGNNVDRAFGSLAYNMVKKQI
ncbi:MAG: GTP-binding protein [Promethearchaeota archaeon]|nr:MAG: GTP-binding protein [Candidatus Lokiarchaeota archaeon]